VPRHVNPPNPPPFVARRMKVLAAPPAPVPAVTAFVAVVVVIVACLVSAGPAFASASGSDSSGGTVTVGASDGGSSVGTSGSSGASGPAGSAGTSGVGPGAGRGGGSAASQWNCTYTSLLLNDEGGFAPGGPTPGGWYSVTCVNRVTGVSTTQTEWITAQTSSAPSAPSAPATPAVDPRVVALQAENSLRLPAPSLRFNPLAASIVNLATWLWIDPAIWHQFTVTVTAGTVTATAVATPVSVTWQMGDGSQVECAGPGQPFDVTRPARQQVTTCQHTYLASSLGQPSPDGDPDHAAYPVRATVTWSVSWTAEGAPGSGVLPSLTTSAQSSIRVVQVESINSGLLGLTTRSVPVIGSPGPVSNIVMRGAPS